MSSKPLRFRRGFLFVGRMFKNACIIFVNTLFILLAVEGVARFFLKESIGPHYYQDSSYMLPEPNTIATHQRHKINGGETIHWQTNSLGIRGPELTAKKGKRIVVYGDSNIQAVFSDLDNTFCKRLEHYLNLSKESPPIQVINAGVQGFGPDQSLLKYLDEQDKLDPDIIILQLFAENDFGDIIRNKLFELSSSGELLPHKTKNGIDPALKYYIEKEQERGTLSSIISKSKAIKYLNQKFDFDVFSYVKTNNTNKASDELDQQLAQLDEEYLSYLGQNDKQYSQFDDSFDLDVIIYPNSPSTILKVGLLHSILRTFKKAVEKRSQKLIVMVQPSIYDLIHFHPFKDHFPQYKQAALSETMEKIAKEENIPTYNLFNDFITMGPTSLFFKAYDAHWNDKGQDLAAKQMANFLLSLSL